MERVTLVNGVVEDRSMEWAIFYYLVRKLAHFFQKFFSNLKHYDIFSVPKSDDFQMEHDMTDAS